MMLLMLFGKFREAKKIDGEWIIRQFRDKCLKICFETHLKPIVAHVDELFMPVSCDWRYKFNQFF